MLSYFTFCSKVEIRIFIFLLWLVFFSMSRDLDITAFVLPAPRLALLGPLAALIMKTALLALIQLLIFLLDYLDHVFDDTPIISLLVRCHR